MRHSIHALLVTSLLALGCGHDVIPNTDVEDNEQNRALITFVEKYRRAVESRDIPLLLTLASANYFDDNGTPSPDDDIDIRSLRRHLDRWTEGVLDVRYDIRYRRVLERENRVYVDYTYSGAFLLKSADGEHWDRRTADNRLVIAREASQLRFISGM